MDGNNAARDKVNEKTYFDLVNVIIRHIVDIIILVEYAGMRRNTYVFWINVFIQFKLTQFPHLRLHHLKVTFMVLTNMNSKPYPDDSGLPAIPKIELEHFKVIGPSSL